MGKYKQFIKDAYNGKLGLDMCSDWKELIEKEFPELVKTKLEVGKWYNYNKALVCYTGSEDGYLKGYGFLWKERTWSNECFLGQTPNEWTPATKEEVEQALIKEAKKRGFKEGVVTECISVGGFKSTITDKYIRLSLTDGDYRLLFQSNDCAGWTCVFKNGKWAEIIETITKKEAEKKLGCKILD